MCICIYVYVCICIYRCIHIYMKLLLFLLLIIWGQGLCMETEHEFVSEAKCTVLVLLNTEETFAPNRKLLRCFIL